MATNTLDVAAAYHEAWTTRDFDGAIALLSPTLDVEVPINDPPTRGAFAAALTSFARRVNGVDVLSRIGHDDEAMILYDMDVDAVGPIRVVEHFTVADGKIVRIRHIHDTAALRPEGGTAGTVVAGDSYAGEVVVGATNERVFQALTTVEGVAGWWTSQVTGDGTTGGRLDLGFAGLDERITMSVVSSVPDDVVVWHCDKHTGHPEWEGTTITFTIAAEDATHTTLAVYHLGLVPGLSCYERCFAGWQHFLRSIKAYAERDIGMPYDRR
jgi:uncharacterized protein YndB with AHSA1/START domain